MAEILHAKNCFGCSLNNPIGLKVKFRTKDSLLVGEFDSSQNHEGPPCIIHGGVIAAIIDESFAAFAVQVLKMDIRTIREEISFRNPARLGDKLYIETSLKEEKSRAIIVETKIYKDDTVIAEGLGTLFKVKNKSYC